MRFAGLPRRTPIQPSAGASPVRGAGRLSSVWSWPHVQAGAPGCPSVGALLRLRVLPLPQRSQRWHTLSH